MSSEVRENLQCVLNSIACPAYIEENNKIVLSNNIFKKLGLGVNFLKEKLEKKGYYIKELTVNDAKICEIKDRDLEQLNQSRAELATAMRLL